MKIFKTEELTEKKFRYHFFHLTIILAALTFLVCSVMEHERSSITSKEHQELIEWFNKMV